MKYCRKCKESKELSDFHKNKASHDGLQHWCKHCVQTHQRTRLVESHRYYKTNCKDLKANAIRWQMENKERVKQLRNPNKQKARLNLNYAVRKGTVHKPETCSVCGKSGRIEGHHVSPYFDYVVRWLCPQCHHDVHTKTRKLKKQ